MRLIYIRALSLRVVCGTLATMAGPETLIPMSNRGAGREGTNWRREEVAVDFESAVNLSPQVEKAYPGIIVVGVRRMSYSRVDSWGLDLMNLGSGQMITLDEKDDWERRLKEVVPELVSDGSR
jgi:hypothetical protein